MGPKGKHCIAYLEREVCFESFMTKKKKLVLVPCPQPRRVKSFFCRQHEQAYRELLIGIVLWARGEG